VTPFHPLVHHHLPTSAHIFPLEMAINLYKKWKSRLNPCEFPIFREISMLDMLKFPLSRRPGARPRWLRSGGFVHGAWAWQRLICWWFWRLGAGMFSSKKWENWKILYMVETASNKDPVGTLFGIFSRVGI
jgi:hypothetical protein